MSDTATEATESTDGAKPDAPAAASEPTVEALQAELDALKSHSRKWEDRAKENSARLKEFEDKAKAAMTDTERAVVEAEARGRTAAITELGQDLARTQFDALAGRRNPGFNTSEALAYVDLSKFLGDDGRPDPKLIEAAVERLVPAASEGSPSYDGGPRTPPPANTDMSGLIRKAAGRA